MKDYREITDKYVQNGINPVISEYNRQFLEIEKFIKNNINSLEYDDKCTFLSRLICTDR